MEGEDESEDHLELITKFTNFLKDQVCACTMSSIEAISASHGIFSLRI